MSVIGVIPARWGSTRLPGKSLVDIAGKSLIQRVVESASKATKLDDLIVATDDQRIFDAVVAFGGKPVMTKEDHPSGTDRVAEAVAGTDGDVVINIQGDEPLIEAEIIDGLAEEMISGSNWDMATAACPITDEADLSDSSVVKVVVSGTGQALYFSRSTIPHIRDHDVDVAEIAHWRHVGIYAYRRSFLEKLVKTPQCLNEKLEKLEQLRALDIGARMFVMKVEEAGIGVDTPEDVEKVIEILNRRTQRTQS
jgi:3-deoxy-manno-octulosonate cytidylyltransferase (CMP-KDO synthetase)